jgi:hypothetical protein
MSDCILSPSDLPNTKFYKLLRNDEIHHGFQYKTGLNIDIIPFNPTGKCSPGGLYFFSQEQLPMFSKYVNIGDIRYIREVTFPDDAKIYKEVGKYKADRFIVGERKEFWLDEILDQELCLEVVKQNGMALKFVKEQTPKICLEAVEQNGFALLYVKEQTPKICLEAVGDEGLALLYVKEQTPTICLTAVKRDGYALGNVKDQTPTICLAAVKTNGMALEYVKEQTPEICLAAVKTNGKALEFVKDKVLYYDTVRSSSIYK